MAITILPPKTSDYEQWSLLWTGYLSHCQTTLPETQYQATWNRLLHPEGNVHALLAWDDSEDNKSAGQDTDGNPKSEPQLLGIAHYVFFASTWSEQPVGNLADLFVSPAARKRGIGRALILAVADACEKKDCRGLKWAMHNTNTNVQALYDSLAVSDFREYRMRLPYVEGEEGRRRRMLADT